MQTKILEKYFFFGLLLSTFIFAILILEPFWEVLVLGISFAIILSPIHVWLQRKKIKSWVSSLLVVLIFLILFFGPVLGIGTMVFKQTQNIYLTAVSNQDIFPFLNQIEDSINKHLPNGLNINIEDKISAFVFSLSNNIANVLSTTLSAFLSFTLMIFAMFYFLKDGLKWKQYFLKLSPLSQEDNYKIIHKITQAIEGVIRGYLFIGMIQGLLMGFGLWIFNVPNPALWGVVTALVSIVPMLGTGVVSIPAIVYLLITGQTPLAIGLLVWATILVGTIDNMLYPYLVGEKIDMPPILILFSVLGGISLMGPIGFLVGPMIMSILHALISIYKDEYQSIENTC